MNRRQVPQPNAKKRLLVPRVGLVVEHRAMHFQKPARAPCVDLVGGDQILRHWVFAGRSQTFFESTS